MVRPPRLTGQRTFTYLLKAVWVLKSKVIDQKSTYPKETTVEGQSWQTGFFQIGSERKKYESSIFLKMVLKS